MTSFEVVATIRDITECLASVLERVPPDRRGNLPKFFTAVKAVPWSEPDRAIVRLNQIADTMRIFLPADPTIIEIARALARQAAREDHERATRH